MVPVVDRLGLGMRLSIYATVTKDDRVALKLGPRFAELLSARRRTATVRLGAQSKKVSWQEQTLLLAGARLTPTDTLPAVKPDEAHVIPLVYSVQSAPPATVMIVTARRIQPRHPARR